jgi:threonine dehydratase
MSTLVPLEAFHAARHRISGVAKRTGLYRITPDQFKSAGHAAPAFELFVKAESEQPIGSFKLRGAYNKIAEIVEADPSAAQHGFITYSSGNHAQGVAYAARAVGAKAVIVMPENAPAIKKEATAALGAEIVIVGNASSDRKLKAEELAAKFGYAMIPPYDDPAIIAGQGTCGLEILEDLPDLVLAPVSGGGLLSGIAAAIKHQRPEVRVVGVEPVLAADAEESFATGKLATWPAELTTRTIADGLRTQSLGLLNFEHVRAFVDAIVTVSEAEIRAAVRAIYELTGLVAEPSGAVATAALLYHQPAMLPYAKAVAVVSGRNIEPAMFDELLSRSRTTSAMDT